jgi:N-acetylglucosaminyldiphosphoundecaprenol N-acetyl-beta-D-mannosaminyltransferase
VNEYPLNTIPSLKPKERQETGVEYKTVDVLGIPVDVLTKAELTAAFLKILKGQKRGWISYVNVHTTEIASQLPWYKNFMESALIRYCDGEGIRFGAYLLGEHIPERITLSYYIYDLAECLVQNKLNVFFLGGKPAVAELAAKKLKELYPTINLSGYHHGYFSEQENNSVIETINACRPDILLLGMGVPKQEEWTQENFHTLNAKIVWMGGGFLDTLSGEKMRCPRWLSEIGFEWFFRLMQEPGRLWKRYLFGNPMFVLRIMNARMGKEGTKR